MRQKQLLKQFKEMKLPTPNSSSANVFFSLYFILVGMTTELYRVNFEICLPIFVVDFKVNEMANSC